MEPLCPDPPTPWFVRIQSLDHGPRRKLHSRRRNPVDGPVLGEVSGEEENALVTGSEF